MEPLIQAHCCPIFLCYPWQRSSSWVINYPDTRQTPPREGGWDFDLRTQSLSQTVQTFPYTIWMNEWTFRTIIVFWKGVKQGRWEGSHWKSFHKLIIYLPLTQSRACFSSSVYFEAISVRLAVDWCRCHHLDNLKTLSYLGFESCACKLLIGTVRCSLPHPTAYPEISNPIQL